MQIRYIKFEIFMMIKNCSAQALRKSQVIYMNTSLLINISKNAFYWVQIISHGLIYHCVIIKIVKVSCKTSDVWSLNYFLWQMEILRLTNNQNLTRRPIRVQKKTVRLNNLSEHVEKSNKCWNWIHLISVILVYLMKMQ